MRLFFLVSYQEIKEGRKTYFIDKSLSSEYGEIHIENN